MLGPRARSVGMLAGLVILFALVASGSAVGAPVPPHGSVPLPLPAAARVGLTVPLAPSSGAQPLGALPTGAEVDLDFGVQPTSYSSINDLIAAQQEPSSPDYHHYLSPAEYNAMFDPSTAQVDAALQYFQSYGFTVNTVSPGLYQLLGSAGAADRAFQTTLESYTSAGSLVHAPLVEPTLPAPVEAVVGNVIGLNSFTNPHDDLAAPFDPTVSSALAREAAHPAPPPPQPHAPQALTLTFANVAPYDYYSLYGGTTPIFVPAVGQNVTLEALVTGGTPTPVANCTWTWTFGDGSSWTYSSANCTNNYATHEYVQAFNQFSTEQNITVSFSDSTGAATGTYSAEVIPSMSTQWMQRYYNELQMVTGGQDGKGTTIGLDEVCDPTVPTPATYTAQVNAFSTDMGLPPLTVSFVGPGSATCTSAEGSSGWSGETLLDMEWAHAMAPDAALQVYFGVDGAAQNYADLAGGDQIWANDLSDGVYIASNSWGIYEGGGFYSLYHNIWAQGAAEGLSFFASSGDCGSTAGQTGSLNVEWPASDPDGVGVGGTILQWLTNATYFQEYVWNGTYINGTCSNNEGGGGGWSCVFPVPSYQVIMPASDPGWAPPTSTSATWCNGGTVQSPNPRGVPDVAADAATWADTDEGGEWLPVGGTSLASPMWAAMSDVILDAIGLGSSPAGLMDYHIYGTGSTNLSYQADFHNVQKGSNCDLSATCSTVPLPCPSTYCATWEWNPAAGWGGPNVANLTIAWNTTFPSYYTVSGFVYNGSSATPDTPVAGASVTIGSALSTTSATGAYLLYVKPGAATLQATATKFSVSTVGVFVNSTDLTNVDLTIYWNVSYYGLAGTVVTQDGAPVGDAVVQQKNLVSGVAEGGAGTNGAGQFVIYTVNGTFQLTASAPSYNNSAPVDVVVNGGNVLAVVLHLYYTMVSVEGQVLTNASDLPVWGASVFGESIQGGSYITSSATTSAAGQFFLHLPEGNASLSASALSYAPASLSTWVYRNGVSGVTLFLYPTGERGNEVNLAIRVEDLNHTTSGVPSVVSGSSVELEVWANNSLTGLPQLGIDLGFASQVPTAVFTSDNLTVGSGAPGAWAAGFAVNRFTAPFLTSSQLAFLTVGVLTPGWDGTAQTQIFLVPNYVGCGSSYCSYNVWGVVVSTSGQRLVGASVQISSTSGKDLQTVVSNNRGIYSVYLANGSYFARPSLTGYQVAPLQGFAVNGTPEEVDLYLQPNAPPLTASEQTDFNAGRNLFTSDWWAIIPIVVLGLLVLIAACFRFLLPEREKEEAAPAAVPAAPSAEQQIFSPGGGGGAPLPSGGGGGGPPALGAPPPESPWEITPAPPPPPPDTGVGPGAPDDTGSPAPDQLGLGDGMDTGGPGEPPAPP